MLRTSRDNRFVNERMNVQMHPLNEIVIWAQRKSILIVYEICILFLFKHTHTSIYFDEQLFIYLFLDIIFNPNRYKAVWCFLFTLSSMCNVNFTSNERRHLIILMRMEVSIV